MACYEDAESFQADWTTATVRNRPDTDRDSLADVMKLTTGLEVGELTDLADFLLHIDGLKHVERQNPTADGSRRERTAEHSWHVAVACLLFRRFAVEEINVERATALAVLHDLPETEVGDTFVYSPAERTRRTREEDAMERLLAKLPAEDADLLRKDWHEYEYRDSPEGRYVMALDILLPVLLNSATPVKSSWKRHGVTAEAVRRRVDSVRAAVPALADLADEKIDRAMEQGYLK
jgi:5'-deoxynucleotidase YfbR-like HD superfamily hydrolase